jgi:hypothetical protein
MIEFGQYAKENFYHLDLGTKFTNHGSYGSVPRPILARKVELQNQIDKNPDQWFRYISFELWNKNVKHLADYLNLSEEKIVLCENATDSMNAALKSIDFDMNNPGQECIL